MKIEKKRKQLQVLALVFSYLKKILPEQGSLHMTI